MGRSLENVNRKEMEPKMNGRKSGEEECKKYGRGLYQK